MAKMVNVNREVQDAFYRYKMPLLTIKVEGKGNGIKTVIPNMVEVAKALARPPSYPTKFFGCELGAQTQMQVEAERYIVNGQHETERFQELLDEFIKKFVLCPSCTNPETVLRVTSKKLIEQKCKACGHIGNIPLVHRLTAYIVNNPPNGSSSKNKKGKTQKERREEKMRRNDRTSVDEEPTDAKSAHNAQLGQIGAQVDAAKARMGGQIEAPDVITGRDDDTEWSTDDLSDEAYKQRLEELGSGIAHLTQTEDLEKPIEQRLEMFEKTVINALKQEKFPSKEVIAEADRLDCKDKGVMIIMQHVIGNETVVAKLKQYQGLLQRFTVENAKAQKYLLGAYEKIVSSNKDALLPKAAVILKNFYDLDIIDEEIIISWNDKISKKYVSKEFAKALRTKVKIFVDWLKEAEEEDSDEEEIFVSNPEEVLAQESKKKEAEADADEDDDEDEDDEDVDIDNL